MPGSKSTSIKDFFKSAQAPAKQSTSPDIPALSSKAGDDQLSSNSNTKEGLGSDRQRDTSSLTPPPSSDLFSSPLPASREKSPLPPRTTPRDSSSAIEREIKGSDEEDSDSDSSFPELSTIFGRGNSTKVPSSATTAFTPSTPTTSRIKKDPYNFHVSPLAVLPKYKFDLKSLVSHAEADEAAEASSKRVKEMLASSENENSLPVFANERHAGLENLALGGLLDSIVANQDDGGMHKLKRALERTETANVEKRWYFFDTESQSPASPKRPFPAKLIPPSWKKEFSDRKIRDQTFISGFAEDMVAFGKALPDEIFLWIINEACFESNEVLRTSYLNTIEGSTEQIERLISPETIQKAFQSLKATSLAVSISEAINHSPELKDPYLNHDWTNLRSVIRFFGRVAKHLQQKSREHILCLLLRMSADHVVCKSIDILDVFQKTIKQLCQRIPDDTWDASCHAICKLIFDSVKQAPFRLQIVNSIPSITPRTHDLRRRLAMCSFFNDIIYSDAPPHTIINFDSFIYRLEEADFDTNSRTNYQQLSALVLLLDIAVDDGRSVHNDLTNEKSAEEFDDHVDALVEAIREVMRNIGNPGAAYISRIEAKEGLELVSQRISDTLRTRPKRRAMHFDLPREKAIEDLGREKAGMSAFLSKMKGSRAEADIPDVG